jgi:hypothetical protein
LKPSALVWFLDASILGEVVHPQNFNTLRRIRDEDGSVLAEGEEFTELASSEFLAQQLKALLDSGGRELLESLPDGIHSGLVKTGARGVFLYFQAESTAGGKQHFWKYFDLKDHRIIDNRYVLANLIDCDKSTPRVVDPEMFDAVFDLQEKVIDDILRTVQEQRALEVAPRSVDLIQQTTATVLQSYLNHPDVDRHQTIEAIRFLNQPMLKIQVDALRKAYKASQSKREIKVLLTVINELRGQFGERGAAVRKEDSSSLAPLTREDVRLVCFDFVSGG